MAQELWQKQPTPHLLPAVGCKIPVVGEEAATFHSTRKLCVPSCLLHRETTQDESSMPAGFAHL